MNTKRSFRYLLTIVILSLVFASAGISRAQMPCLNGLTKDQCEVLTQASENSKTVSSFAMDFNLVADFKGVTGGDYKLPVTASGQIDLSKVKDRNDPEDTANNMAMIMTLDSGMGFTIEIRMVDGYIYSRDSNTKKAVKISLEAARNVSSGVTSDVIAKLNQSELIKMITDILALPDVVEAKATDAKTSDSKPGMEFTFDVNAAALSKAILDPKNRELIESIAKMMNQTLTDKMWTQAEETLSKLEPTFKDTRISINLIVDAETKLINSAALSFSTVVDEATMKKFGGDKELTANISAKITLTKYNEPVKIEPMEDAVDYFTLLGGTAEPTEAATEQP